MGAYQLYNSLRVLWPLIWQFRLRRGQIDHARALEYRGYSDVPRPSGDLIWLHGVSVGESISALPLIEALRDCYPKISILLTSTTHSSQKILGRKQLPKGVIHQYLPMDHCDWVRRFYDHWRPNLGCWIESEFWPNLCLEADRRGISRVLLNGRISRRSLPRWSLLPSLIKEIVRGFQMIRVQDEWQLGAFQSLDGFDARIGANLKDAAQPLEDDVALRTQWQERLQGRQFWLASSTHPGEEEIIVEAHQRLREDFPELLCLLVPRHPERGQTLYDSINQADFGVQLESTITDFDSRIALYIVDSLGQLGIFYRLAPLAFIGGSLRALGGHNLREAALLECVPIVGPYLENFSWQKTYLEPHLRHVSDAESLAEAVAYGLREPEETQWHAQSARIAAEMAGTGVISQVMEDLAPFLAERTR